MISALPLDAAERVHPVRVAGVNAREQAGCRRRWKPDEQGADGGAVMPAMVKLGDRVESFDAVLEASVPCRAGVVKTWLVPSCWRDVLGEVGAGSAGRLTAGRHLRVLPEWQS